MSLSGKLSRPHARADRHGAGGDDRACYVVVLPAAYFLSAYTRHACRDRRRRASLQRRRSRSSPAAIPSSGCSRTPGIRGCSPCSARCRNRHGGSSGPRTARWWRNRAATFPAVMAAASPCMIPAQSIGHVEIQRSLQRTAVDHRGDRRLCRPLGAVAFAVLRSWPLRLLRRALARSTHLATHDTLTGLPNRALFRDRIEQSLAWSRREGTSLAVLYLDLDRFKEVNDTLGHAAGDQLLVGVAGRCAPVFARPIRSPAGRRRIRHRAGRRTPAWRYRDAGTAPDRALAQPFDLDGGLVTVGVSIGIAVGA